jgi:hypothetical protein
VSVSVKVFLKKKEKKRDVLYNNHYMSVYMFTLEELFFSY